jgi:surfeit locus 1 family protein
VRPGRQPHVPQRLSPRQGFIRTAGLTLLALAIAALCVRLGFWQWRRGVDREREWQRFAQGAARLVDPGSGDLGSLPPYQRVQLSGELDGAHQFLLDNRSWQGRAGYEVLTPLIRSAAATALIDRGWVPFTGSRKQLPDVSLSAASPVTLTGRLANLPSAGLALGRSPPPQGPHWPKLTSFPDFAQLQEALGRPLAPRILLLDPAAPFGYLRDWQPPGLPPLRHFGYAVQWWSFALLALVAWVLCARRALRRQLR